jgi:hypothetical protein
MMTLELDTLLEFLWEGTNEAIIEDLIARDPALSRRQFEAARAIVETISGPAGPGANVRNRLRSVERAIAINGPRVAGNALRGRSATGPSALMQDVDPRTRQRRGAGRLWRRAGSSDSRVVSSTPRDPYSIAPPPEPRTVMLEDTEPARLMIQGLPILLHLRPSDSGRERTLSLTLMVSSAPSLPSGAKVLLWRDATVVQSASVAEGGHADFVWVDPGPYQLRIDAERHVIVLQLVRTDRQKSAEPT